MKKLFILILVLPGIALAQQSLFPPQCDARLLTPTHEALCTDLRDVAFLAEKRYVIALGNAETVSQWAGVSNSKMSLLSKYYTCSITGSAKAVTACLQPALQEISEKFTENERDRDLSPTDAAAKARNVNRRIEAHFDGLFKQCVLRRVDALDDGVSSARDIAQAVGEKCRPEASRLADVRYSTLTTALLTTAPTYAQTKSVADELLQPSSLIELVLEYRASKRGLSK